MEFRFRPFTVLTRNIVPIVPIVRFRADTGGFREAIFDLIEDAQGAHILEMSIFEHLGIRLSTLGGMEIFDLYQRPYLHTSC